VKSVVKNLAFIAGFKDKSKIKMQKGKSHRKNKNCGIPKE